MGLIELVLIAVGLSMDAFAVAVCKGLSMKRCTWGKAGLVGAYFGEMCIRDRCGTGRICMASERRDGNWQICILSMQEFKDIDSFG